MIIATAAVLLAGVAAATPPADRIAGLASAALVTARAEHAALLTRYGSKHPAVQEVSAQIERLRQVTGAGLSPAARAIRRARLGAVLTRIRAEHDELSTRYGVKHPKMKALSARLAVLEAAVDPADAAITPARQPPDGRATLVVELARLEGRAAFHAARGLGENHPEVVARQAAARRLAGALQQLGKETPKERTAVLAALAGAAEATEQEMDAARRAMRWLRLRELTHERDAILVRGFGF